MNAPVTAAKLYDCRDAFAETLEALAAANDRVVAVCNDLVGSSKLGGFKSKFPSARQCRHCRTEHGGRRRRPCQWRPASFVCGASCFLTGRALEQIKADLAYSNANVKLIGISSAWPMANWVRHITRSRISPRPAFCRTCRSLPLRPHRNGRRRQMGCGLCRPLLPSPVARRRARPSA